MVVATGSTLDTDLGESLDQLAAVQGTVLGVVLNRVPAREARYGGDYRRTAVASNV